MKKAKKAEKGPPPKKAEKGTKSATSNPARGTVSDHKEYSISRSTINPHRFVHKYTSVCVCKLCYEMNEHPNIQTEDANDGENRDDVDDDASVEMVRVTMSNENAEGPQEFSSKGAKKEEHSCCERLAKNDCLARFCECSGKEAKKEEYFCCERLAKYDCLTRFWDAVWYVGIKVIPQLGMCPCARRCRGKEGTKIGDIIGRVHIGLAIDYDGATNVIQTVLLVSALFLAFVAASATVVDEEKYVKADSFSCQQGWGHKGTCIQMAAGGYFGNLTETGLLEKGIFLEYRSEIEKLQKDFIGQPIIDLGDKSLQFYLWPDAITGGTELPSLAINRFSAMSMALLVLVFMAAAVWYLLLIFSGSRSMGEDIMRIFWVFGLPPLIIMFIGLLTGIFYWILSMVRVMQALLPNLYAVKGLEFGYFTNKDDAVSLAQYVGGWGIEEVSINLCIFVLIPMFVLQGYFTFTEEWRYVITRPKHPRHFVIQAIVPLWQSFMAKKYGENNNKKKQKKRKKCMPEERKSTKNWLLSKIFFLWEVHKKEQETTRREEEDKKQFVSDQCYRKCVCESCRFCQDGNKTLEAFQKFEIEVNDYSAFDDEDVRELMSHFIDMFPHLDWKGDLLKDIKPLHVSSLKSKFKGMYDCA